MSAAFASRSASPRARADIDVIICDHHEPGPEIPDAHAVLDPLKPGDLYPFKYLSGAGVGFKLIQGLAEYFGQREIPYEYLDFVAIAAAADIVPMVGENRILVHYGLSIINESPRPGIRALMATAEYGDGHTLTLVAGPDMRRAPTVIRGTIGDITVGLDEFIVNAPAGEPGIKPDPGAGQAYSAARQAATDLLMKAVLACQGMTAVYR